MNTTPVVVRDERSVAVENASYKWSCIFLTYALLLDGMYRGLVRQEAAWDLMAMVILSGGISTIYQARQKALPQGWAKMGDTHRPLRGRHWSHCRSRAYDDQSHVKFGSLTEVPVGIRRWRRADRGVHRAAGRLAIATGRETGSGGRVRG